MYKVDNAVILAAGASSRFAPLSFERPKALIEVKGEILIERQIRQLQEAGIGEIHVVVGYQAEQFEYLRDKLGVRLVRNDAYLTRNNHSSIHAVRDVIRNTYICSADNYFTVNPFEPEVEESYYAAVYADGPTSEWCMRTDAEGYISHVQVGGANAWYMLGHAFWSEDFSRRFLPLLEAVCGLPQTAGLFWENIFIDHLSTLKMRLRKYEDGIIFEFDSLDELRAFDRSYITDTRSGILKRIAAQLGAAEAELTNITARKGLDSTAAGIRFLCRGTEYAYDYADQTLRRISQCPIT